ncbi:acyl-CoA synthetase (AMP-forming)/AMP-acid ligase II [Fontibacillus phaseoli]|uniref:Acyl-CoA synthetase (AMP-forming)/AMP-acid ligase II n=1 Tax=Fontibacillus phaseoli TaxID=1416533 RepID=A0A369B746_9BACL|nr:class I adenylate-forming enzyme family protein [Fontibacillus phaseoli]RCX17340.1 acyl-CoA synthetase (AMP-forming)/AMP-acid ligase II [Fontibacillus phaseoli]
MNSSHESIENLYVHLMNGKNRGDICLSGHHNVTYGDLEDLVEYWQSYLHMQGIEPDSSVALQLPNSFTFIYLLLALWKHNCQVVLLDFRLKPAESEELMQICHPHYYIGPTSPVNSLAPFAPDIDICVTRRYDGCKSDISYCLIQFTSGSTGKSKVVGRTPDSLIKEIDRVLKAEGSFVAGDKVLILSSISHTYGLLTALLPLLRQGASILFASSQQAKDILYNIHGHRVTGIVGVPFHYNLLASASDFRPWDHVRIAITAGELLPEPTLQLISTRFGISLGQIYGMTETGIISADFPGDFPGSLGRILGGLRHKIERDELYIFQEQSPYIFDRLPERYQDGWLRTFDIAYMDEYDHTLHICGRADSLLIVGGLKVNLTEVEDILKLHPAIHEVVITQSGQQEIEAYISGDSSLSRNEVLQWCTEQMANYKIPNKIFFLPSLPRTATQKLVRNRQKLQELTAGLEQF